MTQFDNIDEPTQCHLVVALADITGFGKASRDKSDLAVFQMLDKFYHLIDRLTAQAGGRVLKFMGDSALMIYPLDKAKDAVASLNRLQSEAGKIWPDPNQTCLVRTKAHIGPVVVGPMGPKKRLDAIGNTLNELFCLPSTDSGISQELQKILAG